MKYLIPIEPVAKGRPRFTTQGGFSRAYSPKKNVDFENSVKAWAIGQTFFLLEKDTPLSVSVDFYITRPKSVSVKKRPFPTVKSDLDNYEKALLDALNGIVWKDDSQIVEIRARKLYAVRGYISLRVDEYCGEIDA